MLLLSGCIHADTVGDAYTVVGFLPEATSTTFHEPEDVVDDGRGERPRVKSSTAGFSMVVEDLMLHQAEREVCCDMLRLAGSILSCLDAFSVKIGMPIQARIAITAGSAVVGLQVSRISLATELLLSPHAFLCWCPHSSQSLWSSHTLALSDG